ncbi:MAG: sulfatase-like hydrolase/transferase [bacterium]
MLLLALALTPLQLASVPSAAAEPNILLIVSDDHGFADLGQAGSLIDTPTLDSLAAAGVVLDRYHTYPICGPTRVGLMTGRNPARLGLTSNISNGEDGVPLDERFLPEIFQDAGYQTWMMGKWHLGGSTGDAYLPQNRGFDHFYGFLGGSIDETEHTSGGTLDWQRNGTDVSEDAGQRATDLLTDEAIALIANRDMSRPFFLYLSFHAVHTPYDAPAELKAKYAALGLTGRDLGYAAMLENMDQNIGRVLDTLEADGIAADTLVVFSSDNGAGEDLGGSNAPLRGWKADVWEGGHRVPAILRWPGVFPAATTSTQFVSHLDWLPTLAAAASLPTGVTAKLDGIDRLEALTTGAAGRPRGHVVQRAGKVAVLDGDWKLVRPMITGTRYYQNPDLYVSDEDAARTAAFIEADIKHKEDPTSITELLPVPNIKYPEAEEPELYNLASDPGEQYNVADQYPDIAHKLLVELETWFESVEADRLSIDDPLHAPQTICAD